MLDRESAPFPILSSRFQELTAMIFREREQWDDLPVPFLNERAGVLRDKLTATPEWFYLEPITPQSLRAFHRRAIAESKRKAVKLAAKVLHHQQQAGDWPQDLYDIQGSHDRPLDLRDPYSGSAFGYRIMDGGAVIYSFNLDTVDDAGSPGRWGEANTDVLLFPWSKLSTTPD